MATITTDPSQLSSEQRELLSAAVGNRGRLRVCIRAGTHGRAVHAKEEKFFDPDDPQVAARYVDSLKQLERQLLVRQADKRDTYELTNHGWLISRKFTEKAR
jgi:hypothetical protein